MLFPFKGCVRWGCIFSMMEDIKNRRIMDNHKFLYLSLYVRAQEYAKDVAYTIFLSLHKHLKTQDVIHYIILPSCPQRFDNLLRK